MTNETESIMSVYELVTEDTSIHDVVINFIRHCIKYKIILQHMTLNELWNYWQSIGPGMITKDAFEKIYNQIKSEWGKT